MVSAEEKRIFEKICLEIKEGERALFGIGTYSEKTLHRVLKHYLCPDTDFHEVGIGPFVADAVVGDTVYEIQSAGLFPLKKKLAYYLAHTDKMVQIVCPVLTAKRIIWVDTESGALSEPRKSPVGHGKIRVLPELIYLLEHLDFERVSLLIVGLRVDDYKLLDGKGADKKRGATRLERLPRELTMLEILRSREDIASFFLPQDLPQEFTSAEFSRLTNLRRRTLSAALKVLLRLDIIQSVGKNKNAILYRRCL